jgi:flagellar hook assembly protein FlgD
LKIYNIAGQLVKTLVDEKQIPNYYAKIWDGKNDIGKEVTSGVYFYKLSAGEFQQTKKLVILR